MILRTIRHDDILEVRLQRPPANALSPELVAALREAVEAAPGGGAEALVLSGSPGLFSAGLDVPHLLTLDRDGIRRAWSGFFRLMEALARSPVPTVAAITGHSPAGGAVLAIHCDLRIMAKGDFRIGLNEVQVGIPMPEPIYRTVRRLVGERQAERLCVSGALITPGEALAAGLVDELAPPEKVVERAVERCRGLLALPRGPMLKTREMARAGLVALFDDLDAAEVERMAEEWFAEETQAGLRAMVARLAAKKGAKGP